MNTFAQILYNKAHWIFQSEETLEQLKSRFAPDMVFIDITNIEPQPQEGWDYNALTGTFSEPIKAITINDINAKYLPQFKALQQSYLAMQITGNTTSAAAIQTAYQALQVEYNQAMEVIS